MSHLSSCLTSLELRQDRHTVGKAVAWTPCSDDLSVHHSLRVDDLSTLEVLLPSRLSGGSLATQDTHTPQHGGSGTHGAYQTTVLELRSDQLSDLFALIEILCTGSSTGQSDRIGGMILDLIDRVIGSKVESVSALYSGRLIDGDEARLHTSATESIPCSHRLGLLKSIC